ncbi:hypothetical protein [Clostridium sp.]|uniref:hypothetical protein n=1 Tax=Clostridium sp. TaxID=1506 RepID=UPI002908C939|nr:hypothetical protein [Clostridium sp.]MDU6522132.1 hypothetical protein [Clostridium sp.]
MKKIKKIFKIAIIPIFLLAILSVITNKLIKKDFDSLNKMDQNMLNQLSQVYEIYNNKSKDIWKEGYTFNDIPLVLTPVNKDRGIIHSYSYVIGVNKLENSILAKKIKIPEEMNLPPVYRVVSIHPSLYQTWLPINFSFTDIGDKHAMLFKYNPNSANASDEEKSYKYFLMHEAFHEYRQVPLWKNINDLQSVIFIEERNEEQYQLLLTEIAILDKARNTNNKDELLDILSDFVTVRDIRYNKFEYMKQEKKVETLEGCAQYIEYRYSKSVGESVFPLFDTSEETTKLTDIFNMESLEILIDKKYLNGFMDKDLYYYIGALEGIFLDKLQISWKDRVENNELIYDIIKSEIEEKTSHNRKNIEDIKKEYGYNNFSTQSKIIVENLK